MKLSEKLRNAANRTTRLNADVALLCEAALQAANHIDSTGWQPFETMPHDLYVCLWIKSHNNPDFCRLASNVAFIDGMFYGNDAPDAMYGEYVSHWIKLTPPE
jgi:hypothetical protein